MDSGNAAEWVSGVATFLAVGVTTVQLWMERKRRRQLEDVQTAMERRDQASKVTAWFDRAENMLYVRNSSGMVVYDVYAVMVPANHESDGTNATGRGHRFLRLVPPGQVKVAVEPGWGGMSFSPSYDIVFRDSEGRTWQRNNWGKLTELPTDVFAHYGLHLPASYFDPEEFVPLLTS